VSTSLWTGFVLNSDPYTVIDLDDKGNLTREKQDVHARILAAFSETYIERSINGRGYHIWCRGSLPDAIKRDSIEVYSRARYMVCTGDVVSDKPIADCQTLLQQLAGEMQPRPTPAFVEQAATLSDDQIWQMAANAANADKFVGLCEGNWNAMGYPSQSEADMALLSIFAFYSKSNEQCRRLFRQTHLGQRPKATKRDDYLNRSLAAVRASEIAPVDSVRLCAADPRTQQKQATATDWPEPKPLPDGAHPVPAFDEKLLPAALRAWLSDSAERMQAPPEFGAAAALVALGSVIGRKCVIRPKRCDDWQCVSNLWGAVVAPPSALKSPALDDALKPLKRLALLSRDAHAVAMQRYADTLEIRTAAKAIKAEALKKALRAGMDPKGIVTQYAAEEPEPTERRYIVNDGTTEKIGELAVANPSGFMVYRDELSGWFASLERDGHENDRALYLEAWSGNSSYTYDRIARGTIHIPALCLSLFGGIQPGPLAQYLQLSLAGGKGHDGLMQRFQVLVYPDSPRTYRNVDRPPNVAARDSAFNIFDRLDKLTAEQIGAESPKFDGLPFLRFANKAQEFADAWRCDLMTRVRQGADHPAVDSHLSKYPSLMPSLALICHLADAPAFPCGLVSLAAAERAAALCGWLEGHARRVYQSVAQAGLLAARALLAKIKAGRVAAIFGTRDVYDQGWSGLADRESVELAVSILVDHDYLRELTEQTAGRPRRRYQAHPLLRVLRVPCPTDSQPRVYAAHLDPSSSSYGGNHG
jgi:putative DNA primase/helicase